MLHFRKKPTILYFSPHQDDELLTMGLDILRNTSGNANVHIILCSDGAKSIVRKVLSDRKNCSVHSGIHEFDISERSFIKSRDLEFIDSCLSLGIKAECIHIPETRMADGTLSLELCMELIRHYTEIYGQDCCICTIFPRESINQHPDHYALGSAAVKLFNDGLISKLRLFLEPYLLFGRLGPYAADLSSLEILHANFFERKKINKAIRSYFRWDPAEGRYAIGAHSMKNDFSRLAANGTFYSCFFERKFIKGNPQSADRKVTIDEDKRKLNSVISSIRSGHFPADEKIQSDYEDLHRQKNANWQIMDGITGRYQEIIRKYDSGQLCHLLNYRIIVSFTSIPERIHYTASIVDQLLKQTMTPDKIILWLSKEEFPLQEKELPDELTLHVQNGNLTIRWCENLKSHKKYLYALKEYKNALIITIDDDLIYDAGLIETLFLSWLKYPECISAARTHYILMDSDGHFMPYMHWYLEQKYLINKPSMELFGTSGAGMLFPPNILDLKLLDPEFVMELCPYADDLWLKTIQVISGVKVVQTDFSPRLKYIPGTQENCLWKTNKKMNDVQLDQIKTWIDKKYGADYLERKIFRLTRTGSPVERFFYAIRNRHILRPHFSLKQYIKKICFRGRFFNGQ